jgi:VanZ family protein
VKRTFLVRIAPFWVAGLVVASFQPWRPGGRHGASIHDVLHFLAYFSTALLLALIARSVRQRIYASSAIIVLGIAIECVQHSLNRGPFEWGDLASDACAAFLACLLAQSRRFREVLVR